MFEKKVRSTSKEDTDQFCVWKKFRSVSKEDTNLFCVWKKFRSASKENTDLFFVWKKGFWWSLTDFEIKEKIKTENQLKNMSKKFQLNI